MKFECDSCQAQYMIADEKLGARGVKVKCKRCSHVIIVRPAKGDAAAAPSERDTFVEREPGTTPDGADGLGLGDDDLGSFALGLEDNEPTRATFDADTEVAASRSSDNDTIVGDPPQPAPVPLASDESTVVGPAPRLFDEDDGPRAEDDNPFLKQKPAAADFGAADSGDDDNPFQGLGDLDDAAGDERGDDEGAFGASAHDGPGGAPAPSGFGLDDDGDLDLGRDDSAEDEAAPAAGGAFDTHASADDQDHDDDVTSPSSDAAPRDASLRMDSELDANPFFGSSASDDEDQQGLAADGGEDAPEPPPAPPPADAMPSLADDGASMPSVGGADDLLEGELAGAFGAMFAEADERGPTQVLDLGRVDQLRAESQRSELGGAAIGGLDELRSSLDSSLDDSFGGVGAPWGAGGGGGATLEGPALGSLESEADDDDEGGWHAAIDDEDVGPLTLRQMGEHIKKGSVDRETLVWRPGMEDWTPAGDTREVRPLFDAVPRPTISPSGEGAAFDVGSPIDDLQPSPFGSDEGNAVGDPFGALPGFDTADSEGAWQPHGLTEVYQAANLAEAAGGLGGAPAPAASAASGSASGGLDDDDDDGGWKPGAGNALASLVSSEIERLDTPGFGESSLPPAADDSLSLNLDNSPLGGLSSGLGGLDLPADAGSDSLGGGFGGPPVSPAGLGGSLPPQGSLGGMPMTPYAAAPTSPLKNPLVLIAGVGGTMIMLLFVVVLLLVFREPAGPVVAQQPPDAVPTAAGEVAAVAAVPVPAAPNPAVAAAVPTPAAEPAPSAAPDATAAAAEPAPEKKPEPEKADAPEKKPTRVASAASERKPQRRAQRRQQPRQEPKPRVQEVRRTRDCDPVLDLDCDEKPLRQSSGGGKTELSPSDVLGVIKRNLRTVDACAAKHGAKGTIKMEWRILKSGNTSSVRVATPSFANTPVGDCVESAVKRWKFPASSKPPSESVKFPFKLKG